jgi:carbon-monoxide dehydrogenase small subunit
MINYIHTSLNVNGEMYEIAIKPHWTLLYVLRNVLGFTGVKYGCGSGECGSCAVLVDGNSVPSCMMLAVQSTDKKIVTIEGLANDEKVTLLQEAFIKYSAFQCGYCTPGMIITAKAFLDKHPNPTEKEVREAIGGNICRCTGYVNVIKAILSVVRSR